MHEQIIGTYMSKDAARCLADGGASGGDDVGFLELFAHDDWLRIFNQFAFALGSVIIKCSP